jgi:hypothetical protein
MKIWISHHAGERSEPLYSPDLSRVYSVDKLRLGECFNRMRSCLACLLTLRVSMMSVL